MDQSYLAANNLAYRSQPPFFLVRFVVKLDWDTRRDNAQLYYSRFFSLSSSSSSGLSSERFPFVSYLLVSMAPFSSETITIADWISTKISLCKRAFMKGRSARARFLLRLDDSVPRIFTQRLIESAANSTDRNNAALRATMRIDIRGANSFPAKTASTRIRSRICGKGEFVRAFQSDPEIILPRVTIQEARMQESLNYAVRRRELGP